MAGNQKNFAYFKYVADNGDLFNVRGESGGALGGVDGHATDLTLAAWGAQTKRRHVRYLVYQHPTTFRTTRGVAYTLTAYNAVAVGDVVPVQVQGVAAAVNYTIAAKIPERRPIPKAARSLADIP